MADIAMENVLLLENFECRTEEVETSESSEVPTQIQTVMVVSTSDGSSPRGSSPEPRRYVIHHNGEGNVTTFVDGQEMYVQHNQPNMEALIYPVYTVNTNETATWNESSPINQTYITSDPTYEPETTTNTQTNNIPTVRASPVTLQWLLDHYEACEGVSLPRSTLYAHYLRHCAHRDVEPINAASFGKLIRSVFVGLRTRRLGTRGNSKYHYYGIRAKPKSPRPGSPVSETKESETKPEVGRSLSNQDDDKGESNRHLQYVGGATLPDLPELSLEAPLNGLTEDDVEALRELYRDHCESFLEAVAALELATVERLWREFWRRGEREEEDEKFLAKEILYRLAERDDVATWMRNVDITIYQRAVEILLPDVLRPIPSALTHAVRNFAKALEAWLSGAMSGCPAAAVNNKSAAASALAAALRRYTSLNHLAQAARAVLHNSHQIHQMLADLNRVEFKNVREQAAWVCRCGSSTAASLEAEFKAQLGRGASLEQWARWLEACVSRALPPNAPRLVSRARRFLLDWSFYSSMVIRDLTLRSAASFGSFHLIRLLYDEYVFYLVERRVALHLRQPPIAVLHEELYKDMVDPDNDLTEEEMKFDDDTLFTNIEAKKMKFT